MQQLPSHQTSSRATLHRLLRQVSEHRHWTCAPRDPPGAHNLGPSSPYQINPVLFMPRMSTLALFFLAPPLPLLPLSCRTWTSPLTTRRCTTPSPPSAASCPARWPLTPTASPRATALCTLRLRRPPSWPLPRCVCVCVLWRVCLGGPDGCQARARGCVMARQQRRGSKQLVSAVMFTAGGSGMHECAHE